MSETSIHPRESYTEEVDRVDEQQWNSILEKFDDANLMQTWSYASARWGQDHLSHVLLRENSEIVAAAQVVTKTMPFLGAGVSFVRGGPIWQLRGRESDPEILRQMLRALRRIFVNQRGLLLQISPPGVADCAGAMRRLFEEEWLTTDVTAGVELTALIDLSHPLEDMRRSLRSTWRRNLVLAERNNFTIQQGSSDELFEAVGKLYVEGLRRKHLTAIVSLAQLKKIQKDLPESQKMRVLLCEYQGEPVSGVAVPCLGNTAQALLSGTADRGLNLRGSYLLQWRMLEWLEESGYRWYDLDGISRDLNSGDTQFKLGFAGRLGLPAERFGRFDSSDECASLAFVKAGLRIRKAYTGIRVALNSGLPTAVRAMRK
ncbi:MAG: peptidoglycan bridge formation glycyltransferase FemA/FemB family protein [Terriglobales bacterium]